MIFFAKLFEKLNQSLFSFFSGIFVSLSLNIFTTILLDNSRTFSVLNVLSLLLLILASGILIIESILIQNYIETVMKAKTIKMSIEQVCNSPNIRKIIIKLIIYLGVSVLLIVCGLISLYFDLTIA